MFAAYPKILTRVLFGRSCICSRGNCLLPHTEKYIVTLCADRAEYCPRPKVAQLLLLRKITQTSHRNRYLHREVLKLGLHCFLLINLESRHFCSNQNQHLNMPGLKKGKKAGSVIDLVRGKMKKNKKEADPPEGGATNNPDSTILNHEESTDGDNPELENSNQEDNEDSGEEETAVGVVEAEPDEEIIIPDGKVDLKTVLTKLEKFAPLSLAEEWDNVGLLVEPTSEFIVTKIFLTNDLTEEVLEEAIASNSNFILSYHPPIFSPLKRLTMKTEKERIIVKAIEKGIAIYSPHTAHDAARGGVNDWLLSAFGNKEGSAISCSSSDKAKKFRLEISVVKEYKQKVLAQLTAEIGISKVMKKGDGSYLFTAVCDRSAMVSILSSLNTQNVKRDTQITKLFSDPCSEIGMGRFVTLLDPIPLETCIKKVKEHLEIEHCQLALGKGKTLESPIQSVAVCAGSGGKVLTGTKADLYLTGEMSHHEVLAAVSNGTCVITCNHSNTERGFLKDLKEKLEKWLAKDVPVQVSEVDADPLKVV